MLKKLYAPFLCLFLFFLFFFFFFIKHQHVASKKVISQAPAARKTILVFTSSGGRGHISATEALREYLGDLYEVKPVYVLRDVLGDLDFVANLTGGKYHSEELYNYFLVRKQTSLVKPMVWAGKMFFTMHKRTIEYLLDHYVQEINPAMIISVMPMVNGITAHVAEKHNIPFWIIPTDFDALLFMYQVYRPHSNQFFVNCLSDDVLIKKTSKYAALKPTQHTYAGMPVREQFLKAYDIAQVKQKYQVPENKPVVMFMMGGRGMQSIRSVAKKLVTLQIPVHLLLCIGNQPELVEPLKALECAPGVTMSVIEFTPHIAELMAISDLFITKSGGQSVSEALYMKLPMLIDATSPALDWELLNRTFVKKNNLGMLINSSYKLVPTIQELLHSPEQIATWRKNIAALNLPNSKEAIRKKVIELIGI